jgi:hypothetical protein
MAERPLKKTSLGLLKQFNASADELAAAGLDIEDLGTHTIRRNSNDMELTDPNVGTVTLNQLRSTARVSSNDTTPNFLAQKIVAGDNISVTELNDGGNETLEISYDPSVLNYVDTALNDAGLVKNTQTFEVYMTLNANVPIAGDYKVTWSYQWSLNDASNDFVAELRENGNVVWDHIQEPKDAGGTGINLPNTDGGNTNTGTSQRYGFTMHDIFTLSAGANAFDVQFRCSANNDRAAIYKGRISIEKWGVS